jgi:hypothetical protein
MVVVAKETREKAGPSAESAASRANLTSLAKSQCKFNNKLLKTCLDADLDVLSSVYSYL